MEEIILEGRKVTFRNEPLTRDVLKAKEYFYEMLLGLVDLQELSEEEKMLDIKAFLLKKVFSDNKLATRFLTENDLAGMMQTITLSTGLNREEILDFPIKELYQRSQKALGGTAEDFFAELGESVVLQMKTKRMKKL